MAAAWRPAQTRRPSASAARGEKQPSHFHFPHFGVGKLETLSRELEDPRDVSGVGRFGRVGVVFCRVLCSKVYTRKQLFSAVGLDGKGPEEFGRRDASVQTDGQLQLRRQVERERAQQAGRFFEASVSVEKPIHRPKSHSASGIFRPRAKRKRLTGDCSARLRGEGERDLRRRLSSLEPLSKRATRRSWRCLCGRVPSQGPCLNWFKLADGRSQIAESARPHPHVPGERA